MLRYRVCIYVPPILWLGNWFFWFSVCLISRIANRFPQLIAGIEKYNITAENLYNWDEKGFIIGHASATQRIMSLEAFKSERIQYASEDGSREFISLLVCISADGTALPPALISKDDSLYLQDTWLEDWVPTHKARFAISPNGWSCNALGLNWLETVFDRYTH